MHDGEIDKVQHPVVLQISKPIGIQELDDQIIARLSENVQAALASKHVGEWKRLKPRFYNGVESKIRNPGGGTLTIGDANDMQALQQEVNRFSHAVIGAVKEFCHDCIVHPDQNLQAAEPPSNHCEGGLFRG